MNIVTNPFASPAYEGIVSRGSDYVDYTKQYVYDVTLTGLQRLTNVVKSVDTDADFIMYGLQIPFATSNLFQLRLFDAQGQGLSDDLIYGSAYTTGTTSVIYPYVPGVIIPAGGNIGINLVDLSTTSNTIQLVFHGVKRYRA